MRLVVFGHERGRTWTHTHKDRIVGCRARRKDVSNQSSAPLHRSKLGTYVTHCVYSHQPYFVSSVYSSLWRVCRQQQPILFFCCLGLMPFPIKKKGHGIWIFVFFFFCSVKENLDDVDRRTLSNSPTTIHRRFFSLFFYPLPFPPCSFLIFLFYKF